MALFQTYGPQILIEKFRCYASWKRIHGALILHCSVYISKIVWWLKCLILVFSVIYLNSWGYIGWGPVRVFKKFRSLFSFLPFFFSFLFFIFIVCLSGDSLAPGPLDIVHPCHPDATLLHKADYTDWRLVQTINVGPIKRGTRGGALVVAAPWGMNLKQKQKQKTNQRGRGEKERKKERLIAIMLCDSSSH